MTTLRLAALGGLACVLAACGGADPAEDVVYRGDEMLENGMTVKEMIESRQHNLKDLGGAYKTINDQLRTNAPNTQEIGFAAAEVLQHAENIGFWFPEGTGLDAGVETETLATVWEDPEGFAAAVEQFKTAAVALNTAAQSGDLEAIGTASRPAGAACKNCHDNYRLDED